MKLTPGDQKGFIFLFSYRGERRPGEGGGWLAVGICTCGLLFLQTVKARKVADARTARRKLGPERQEPESWTWLRDLLGSALLHPYSPEPSACTSMPQNYYQSLSLKSKDFSGWKED